MPRQARIVPGGIVYHVINRGVGRMTLFENEADYAALERCLRRAQQLIPIALFCYCIMPNHWHLVLRPREAGDLGNFMQRFTLTHARRWQEHRHVHGTGHVYQGRYKSFPIQSNEHFLTVGRYVESNAKRAGLAKSAENWRWCSLWRRMNATDDQQEEAPKLSHWPTGVPPYWVRTVNAAQSQTDLKAVRRCVNRGQPFGGERWVKRITGELALESTFRPRGRPRKETQ